MILDNNGNQKILLKGADLKGLLKRRITVPPSGQATDSFNASIETIVKSLVSNNFAGDRAWSELNVPVSQNRGPVVQFSTRYKNLHDEIERLSIQSGVGWDMSINTSTRKVDFDLVFGVDRSAGQTVNSRVIFSPDYDSVRGQKYIQDDINTVNHSIVAGQGSGASRTIVEVGSISGIARIEEFIDARDTNDVGELTTRGTQLIDNFSEIQAFEGDILEFGTFQYLRDWTIGDIVTIQNKDFGVTLSTRVTEVKIVYDNRGYRVSPIFNNKLPEIIDIIKRINNNSTD